jgi:triosephosphate isomerase (TIM)
MRKATLGGRAGPSQAPRKLAACPQNPRRGPRVRVTNRGWGSAPDPQRRLGGTRVDCWPLGRHPAPMTTPRRPLIAGNWKMNLGGPDGVALAQAVAAEAPASPGVDVVVAPPATVLAAVVAAVGGKIGVAAQNMHPADNGAFTGELSASMIKAAGSAWVILGHSERRQYFGETDESVKAKTVAALRAGLKPIVCIGETLEEREAGRTLEVVTRQLDAVIDVLAAEPGVAAIAYEPVWAIGTGRVATTEQAQEVHASIRARLTAKSPALAQVTRVLYGGSVKPDNAAALLACPDIDGALVGGASLTAASFLGIVRGAA